MPNRGKATINHDTIRNFIEERGGKPACVRQTGGKGDIGLLRFDFPGYSGAQSLQEITWDQFFDKFEEKKLAVVMQEETAKGERSNFVKLVSREAVELDDEDEGPRQGGGAKGNASGGQAKATPAKGGAKAGAAATGAAAKGRKRDEEDEELVDEDEEDDETLDDLADEDEEDEEFDDDDDDIEDEDEADDIEDDEDEDDEIVLDETDEDDETEEEDDDDKPGRSRGRGRKS